MSDTVIAQWNRAAERFAEAQEHSEYADANKAIVKERFRRLSGESVLDLGCGYGWYTDYFQLSEETALTVYNDGTPKNNRNQNICLAFTVDDIEREYKKVKALGARIIEPPTARPWGAANMSFYDPDNNVVYLRSFTKNG